MTFQAIANKESGGDDSAKASTSSATGRYQFITDTWNTMANSPEGKKKKIPVITDEMAEYMRVNKRPHPEDPRLTPELQDQVMRLYTGHNAAILNQHEIEPSDKNLYIMHFLGEGDGVKLLKGLKKGRDARQDFPNAAGANPTIFRPGRTYKEVYDIQTRALTDDTKTGHELLRERLGPQIEELDKLKESFPEPNKLLGDVENQLQPQTQTSMGNMFYNLAPGGNPADTNVLLPFDQTVNLPSFENKLMVDPLRGFFDYVRSGGKVSPKIMRALRKGATYVPEARAPTYGDQSK